MVMSIDVQFVVSGCPYPFGRHADELENECLDPAALLQSEGFRVNPPHEELIEVAYHSRQQQEHGVLCYEGLWQPCPSEIVVLAVKDLFCRAPLVVVQYDFLVGHVPVVGQYAAVCILAVEEVKLLALLLTPLCVHFRLKCV